jgi:transcriptional regulator GlxA family with amidase domain
VKIRRDSAPPDECGVDPRVRLALDYMQAHVGEPGLSLERVARHVNLSKWHFDRLLKRFTGASFREAVALMRVKKAQHLLETTSFEIKEIAARAGYTYSSELTRHFRRFLGTTPVEVRRRSSRPVNPHIVEPVGSAGRRRDAARSKVR